MTVDKIISDEDLQRLSSIVLYGNTNQVLELGQKELKLRGLKIDGESVRETVTTECKRFTALREIALAARELLAFMGEDPSGDAVADLRKARRIANTVFNDVGEVKYDEDDVEDESPEQPTSKNAKRKAKRYNSEATNKGN